MATRRRRLQHACAVGLVAAAGALVTPAASAQAVARSPRTITLGEISASFEALAAQVGSSTVQVVASGLALDPDAPAGDGAVERRRSVASFPSISSLDSCAALKLPCDGRW
jgi:hypothetical protein